MDFIQTIGYDIAQGKAGEYQQWLAANEGAWKAAMPEGTKYVGTYAAVYSSEKNAGSFFTIYQLDSYAAQDRLAEAGKSGEFARIMNEAMAFADFEKGSGWSQVLLKNVNDATVWS